MDDTYDGRHVWCEGKESVCDVKGWEGTSGWGDGVGWVCGVMWVECLQLDPT